MTEVLEIARGNYLKPNGHGGYLLSYSQLSSWAYCQLKKHYEDVAKNDPEAPQPAQLSRTSYGVVIHWCAQRMEQLFHEGDEKALDKAITSFDFYWHPSNIAAITPPVTEWLRGETWNGLRDRGRITLRNLYSMLRTDRDYFPLALEYEFHVPIVVEGRTHTIRGFVDRLGIKKINGRVKAPIIALDDLKTGNKPAFLRHSVQGSLYAYASTQPEFWHGWEDSGLGALNTFDPETIGRLESTFSAAGYRLHEGSPAIGAAPLAPRKFRWVDLQDFKFADGGYRNERDYARLKLAIDAYVRANEAEVFSPNISGSTCTYCSFRTTCGGIGLPAEHEGGPN